MVENITIEIEFAVRGIEDGGAVDDPKNIKKEKEIKDTKDTVESFETGNVGDIQKFSSQQFGNVKQMATNPVQFIFGTVIKKMGKFAKFGAFAFFALLIDQAVKFVLNELMEPGRILDRRFKLLADKQILLFTERKEQQELRQGFKSLIVSTIPGLRGLGIGGQISGNLYTGLDKIPLSGIDPRLITPQKIKTFDHRQKFGSHTRGARGINS